MIFTACGKPAVDPEPAAEVKADRYVAGIEVGSTGPRGMIVGLGQTAEGVSTYGELIRLDGADSDEIFTDDGTLNDEEQDVMLTEIDRLVNLIDQSGKDVRQIFLVFSIAYTNTANLNRMRSRITARYPRIVIDLLTPELEARANYFTMQGRIDLDFSDFILVDIGGSSTILSVFDHPRSDTTVAIPLMYGSRSTLEAIDPLSDFVVRRPQDRRRMDALVHREVNAELKKILRSEAFRSREKVVFVGGLVYKIIKTLDVPLTGTLIGFSRDSEGDPIYRFLDLVISGDEALKRGPDYRREELYTSLRLLETISGELKGRNAAFFFERSSWIPGYVLAKLKEEGNKDVKGR